MSDDKTCCELCGKEIAYADAVSHVDGYLCAACDAEFTKAFESCAHDWVAIVNDFGEPAAFCERCTGTVVLEDFPRLGLDPATVKPEVAA